MSTAMRFLDVALLLAAFFAPIRRTFMQITLNQDEIEKAIITYVGNQGISITGKNVDVTLVAGRGPNGMSATIDISNDPIHTSATPTPRGLKGSTVLTVATDAEESNDSETETVEENVSEETVAQRPLFGA
jgi:hypothetical protein